MRAAVLDGGRFVVRDVPRPETGPDELLIEVRGCGVCGSDLTTRPLLGDGTIMGHEFAGVVAETGSDVDDWRIGEPVAVFPVTGCGSCGHCRFGCTAHCLQARPLGLGMDPGGFAEFAAVRASQAVRLDPRLDVRLGALVEPLAVARHAVAHAAARHDGSVLVIGAGPVGLAVVAWSLARHLGTVTVSDPVPERRAAALAMGAHRVIDPTIDHLGTGYRLVVECVGAPGLLAAAIDAVEPGEQIVMTGVSLAEETFAPVAAITKDVTIRFAGFYLRSEFTEAAQALADSTLDLTGFVSRYATLDEMQEVVEALAEPGADTKVIITP